MYLPTYLHCVAVEVQAHSRDVSSTLVRALCLRTKCSSCGRDGRDLTDGAAQSPEVLPRYSPLFAFEFGSPGRTERYEKSTSEPFAHPVPSSLDSLE